jgi:glycosyltransferase involved in cell wall biosynthesis
MNIFIIPSWYPSQSNPAYGIFVKEQIEMMSRYRPQWEIGVSTWGQGDERKLLWIKDHLKNLGKIKYHTKDLPITNDLGNLHTMYQPALSWTKRFRRGNLREIIRCNELNLNYYSKHYGKPDLISVQAGYPGALIADYLSAKYSIPYHVHLRLGGDMFERLLSDLGSTKKKFISAVREASLLTATSQYQKRSLLKWFEHVEVLHNPVDTNFFQTSYSNHGEGIVAIGRLETEKGFDLLLEALSKVDVKAIIIGSGGQEEKLRQLLLSLGLEERVSFVGELGRDGVRAYLLKSKFLVLPSRYETFGNVLLEAMASGRPVVATRCGGTEEIVNQQTGLLCEPNSQDLRVAIQKMISSSQRFSPVEIRSNVERSFSPEVWITKVESLFSDVLSK